MNQMDAPWSGPRTVERSSSRAMRRLGVERRPARPRLSSAVSGVHCLRWIERIYQVPLSYGSIARRGQEAHVDRRATRAADARPLSGGVVALKRKRHATAATTMIASTAWPSAGQKPGGAWLNTHDASGTPAG